MPAIAMKKTVQVEATTLSIHMKVCDQFSGRILDQNGDELLDYEGYVPSFMPGEHFGDYVILEIDLDTGQIKNWKKPTAKQIEELLASGEAE
jgi:hypothetical protein